jgi:hypothetical protein
LYMCDFDEWHLHFDILCEDKISDFMSTW